MVVDLMNRLGFALALSFLSITIAEFATGSTPLTNIIVNPGSFFLFSIPSLLGLYGCGVILIREAAVRWNRSWPTILMLGIAYGIMEEGVSVHTFFAPVNVTVGVLGAYGKVLGLNLTWAIMISLFHSVFSISLPILISERLWPAMRQKPILTRRSMLGIMAAYITTVFILNLVAPYRPSTAYTLLLAGISIIIILAAKRAPRVIFHDRKYSPGVIRYALLGLFFFPFLLIFSTNQRFLPPFIVDAELITVSVLFYWQLESHFDGNEHRKRSYLVAFLLMPVMVFGVVESLTANPLGLVALFLLAYIIVKLFRSVEYRPVEIGVSI